MSSDLSILILNYNGREHLQDCFDSLRRQTCQDFHAVLIDNGSDDDSVPFVQRHFPEIEIVQLPHNIGFCRGYNTALRRQFNGDWAFLLNNDTSLEPDCIESIQRAIEQNPEVNIFAPKMVRFERPHIIDSAGLSLSKYGVMFDRGSLRATDDPAYAHQRFVFGGCGGAVVYSKRCLSDVGLFDEDFEAYAEDADLAFRAQLYGYHCLYLPNACVRHKRRATSRKRPDWLVYNQHRNMEYVYIKNMPRELIVRLFPLHLAYVMLSMSRQISHGRSSATIRAKLDVLRNLPQLRSKRSVIQANKRVSATYIRSLFEPYSLISRFRRENLRQG